MTPQSLPTFFLPLTVSTEPSAKVSTALRSVSTLALAAIDSVGFAPVLTLAEYSLTMVLPSLATLPENFSDDPPYQASASL